MNDKQVVRVRDVMRETINFVDGIDTVSSALEIMKKVHTAALIVNKRHDDDEYGIILLSDIARKVLAKDRSPNRVNVYEVMSKPVVSVDSRMDIRYCARLFSKFGMHYAPVIEDHQIMGMISYADMVLGGFLNDAPWNK
jgi:signal-transduction protein with cAMP-binding, CBS, and nucleotidyltransferase domain